MLFNSILKEDIKEIIWYVPLELNHSSYIFTSMILFANRNGLKFKISYRNLNSRGQINTYAQHVICEGNWYTKVCFVDFVLINGNKVKLAFDLNDIPHVFSKSALESCDIIFKRSYNFNFINKLPEKFRNKIKKLGLPFMVRPNKMKHGIKISFLFYAFKYRQHLKLDKFVFNRFLKVHIDSYKSLKCFFKTRTVSDFEYNSSYLNSNIFYQKRLFYSDSIDVKELTKQRVEVVKILKNNFKDFYVGGLMKNDISEKFYSDYISNISGDQHSFLLAFFQCGICVYTRGLQKSTGWTLSEFLALGKCIVAERVYNVIPVPLENNKHVVFFEDESEIVDICFSLIKDENRRINLGNNAKLYYKEYVSPNNFVETLFS